MICYKLLSWQGTYPRPTGKGCIVLTGMNLIQFEVPPVSVTYIEKDLEGNLFINKEKGGENPFDRAKNQLLAHLKTKHHENFKFMKVADLTIGDEIKSKPCGMEW